MWGRGTLRHGKGVKKDAWAGSEWAWETGGIGEELKGIRS